MKKSDWALVGALCVVLAFELGPVLIEKFEKAALPLETGQHRPSVVVTEKPPPHDGAFKISAP